jgi:hypothetical protein
MGINAVKWANKVWTVSKLLIQIKFFSLTVDSY